MDDLFKQMCRIAYTGYVPQDKLNEMLGSKGVMSMTKQQIAKRVDELNWANIQTDCPDDGFMLECLKEELMKLEKEDAIKVLFAVIEAQNLPDDFLGGDRIMHEFKHI